MRQGPPGAAACGRQLREGAVTRQEAARALRISPSPGGLLSPGRPKAGASAARPRWGSSRDLEASLQCAGLPATRRRATRLPIPHPRVRRREPGSRPRRMPPGTQQQHPAAPQSLGRARLGTACPAGRGRKTHRTSAAAPRAPRPPQHQHQVHPSRRGLSPWGKDHLGRLLLERHDMLEYRRQKQATRACHGEALLRQDPPLRLSKAGRPCCHAGLGLLPRCRPLLSSSASPNCWGCCHRNHGSKTQPVAARSSFGAALGCLVCPRPGQLASVGCWSPCPTWQSAREERRPPWPWVLATAMVVSP